MSVIVLLIVAGGVVAAGFLGAFVWAVRSGQFDDTCTPAVRVLLDEAVSESTRSRSPRITEAAEPGSKRLDASRESRGWY